MIKKLIHRIKADYREFITARKRIKFLERELLSSEASCDYYRECYMNKTIDLVDMALHRSTKNNTYNKPEK